MNSKRSDRSIERFAVALLGLAFTGHFVRFLWMQASAHGQAPQMGYSPDAVLEMVGSPLWSFTGAMHLLAAVALAALAVSSTAAESAGRRLAGIAAIIGGVCFLILSMSHFQGLAQIESAHRWCAANGHAALVTYNLLRVIVLSGGMFALGAYLLIRTSARTRGGLESRGAPWVGISAGLLSMIYVFAPSASSLVAGSALAGIVVWSLHQLITVRNEVA